jgi:hypothetical protein
MAGSTIDRLIEPHPLGNNEAANSGGLDTAGAEVVGDDDAYRFRRHHLFRGYAACACGARGPGEHDLSALVSWRYGLRKASRLVTNGWSLSSMRYSPVMNQATTKFECSTCRAEYKLVRVEAPPNKHDKQLTCLGCGAPLRNREGKFALKYFRVSDGADPGRGHRPRLM